MGWPEFQKCCGCLSLTTGTIVIGSWILIINIVNVIIHVILLCIVIIQYLHDESVEGPPVFAMILISLGILLNGIQSIVGLLLIIFRNNGKYLGKLVFYMIVVALTKLLVSIVGATTESSLGHYISAVFILLDGYFVLIVRSNQLQLEGRLTNPIDVRRRRRSLEHGGATTAGASYSHNMYPPPPPYEEVMRYGAVYRCDFAATLSPTQEVTNEDSRDPVSEQISVIPSTPVAPQTLASGSASESDKKEFPHEPECIIYDEGQFTVINSAQVAARSRSSKSAHELQTAL